MCHDPLLLLLLLLLLNWCGSAVCSTKHHSTTFQSLRHHLPRHWCHLATCTLCEHQSAWHHRRLIRYSPWLRGPDNPLPRNSNLEMLVRFIWAVMSTGKVYIFVCHKPETEGMTAHRQMSYDLALITIGFTDRRVPHKPEHLGLTCCRTLLLI